MLGIAALLAAVWALLCWLIVRILHTGHDRLWLAAGLVIGVGLADSDLVAFLAAAVVAGLAISGPRRPFTSAWFYAGGALALAMWAPYLVWQARAGLVRLFRDRALRWCRALGVAYLVLAGLFLVTGGKPYYLGGMFPLLLAAGAGPVVGWLGRGRRRLRTGLISAAVALSLTAVPLILPVLPVADLRSTPIVQVNYDAGETVGWPAYVREIAAVYGSLPAARRPSTVVLASNYGEAGAAGRYGRAAGLPPAYSGDNGYWYWGPAAGASAAVAVGFDRATLAGFCGGLRLAARLNNHLGVANQEQGAPVWVCSQLRAAWTASWPRLRDFG